MLIDPRKTTLVLLSGYTKSGHVPSWIHKRELNEDVREFLNHNAKDYPVPQTLSPFTHMG